MTESTASHHDDVPFDETELDEAAEARLEGELAPEESLLEGWLPTPSPTDGPAPAP
ncbi:hypothetical protein [Agromyces salentinus]|uniref:Uncharacterized protein n=1 Tax=Agromyces salentinus TaxID=269421 RepID=A0ABN2MSQ1_9MICO|nr:hypothetical protein [Agromyces salentinus]